VLRTTASDHLSILACRQHVRLSNNPGNAGIHGRIARREQVQISLGFAQHQGWVGLFMDWWERHPVVEETRETRRGADLPVRARPAALRDHQSGPRRTDGPLAGGATMKAMIRVLWQRSADEQAIQGVNP